MSERGRNGDRVRLSGIVKSFGATPVLDGVDLAVREGEFLTLVGASGCGKSTLLRIIAGLERADRGSVEIAGRRVDSLPPGARDVAMVFQSYALYPHMTVAGNLATPLEMRRLSLPERLPLLRLLSPRRRRVMREILRDVHAVARGLHIDHLLERRPAQLSGGQRQRVALGRAMVRKPSVFLMDEPLSNLDAALRVEVRGELAELHARLGATILYVTHDQVEAMTLSGRVAMMDRGRILQLGTPADLYDRPATLAVAQFIGSPQINTLRAEADGAGGVRLGALRLAAGARLAAGTAVTLAVRPEALAPVRAGAAASVTARLARVENLGAEWLLYLRLALPGEPAVTVRLTSAEYAEAVGQGLVGDRLALALRPGAPHLAGVHLFGADGERLAPEPRAAAFAAD
ncbi:MAG: ABC transporter ATP-binding protein [Acetobacteraceae bacterium]